MADETENTEQAEDTTPEVSVDEQATQAFSEAVQTAEEDGAPPVKAEVADPAPAEKPATEAAKPEPTPEEKAAAEAKAKVDAEIAELKLSGEKAKRFRELSARPTKEEVEKQIAPIRELAQQAEQFNEIIRDTRANPEQIGTAFRYLKAINSGDRELMRGALKSMTEEVAWLAKTLGEHVGGFDPITEHKDLNDRVEAGEITADVAREVAASRARNKLDQERSEAQKREQQAKEEQESTVNQAMQQVNALNERLKANDPHFAEKLKVLSANGTIDLIKEFHPSQWARKVEEAYARIPNPAPKAPVAPMPLRPSGAPASTMSRTPKNDMEAFSIGVEAARAQGQ